MPPLAAEYQSGSAPTMLPATDATLTMLAPGPGWVATKASVQRCIEPTARTSASANGIGLALAGPALLTR